MEQVITNSTEKPSWQKILLLLSIVLYVAGVLVLFIFGFHAGGQSLNISEIGSENVLGNGFSSGLGIAFVAMLISLILLFITAPVAIMLAMTKNLKQLLLFSLVIAAVDLIVGISSCVGAGFYNCNFGFLSPRLLLNPFSPMSSLSLVVLVVLAKAFFVHKAAH